MDGLCFNNASITQQSFISSEVFEDWSSPPMLSVKNIPGAVAAMLAAAASAQELIQPRTNTWNSTFSLTDKQIGSLNLSDSLVNNLNVVVQWEQTNWATGSVFTDPFYSDLPANATDAPAGSILKVEPYTDPSTYNIAPSLSLSRIVYQSKTLNGTLVPVSAFILWPYYPKGGAKKVPLVSWGHGTAGLTAECAPSHMRNLLYQFSATYSIALAGYAVVATDYAGLGVHHYPDGSPIVHQYVANPAGGNDLLYAAQAAQAAFPGELSDEFVVVGHSQGGGTAWAAAQQQLDLQIPGYLGTVAMSPVTSTIDLVKLSGSSLAAIQAADCMSSIWPEFDRSEFLTGKGEAALQLISDMGACATINNVFITGFMSDPSTAAPLTKDEFMESYWTESFANLTTSGGKDFAGPLLVLQGTSDALIPEILTSIYVQKTCALYPDHDLEYITAEGIGHVATTYAFQQLYLDWIHERFQAAKKGHLHDQTSTGETSKASCRIGSIGSTAPRAFEQYQDKINYYFSHALDRHHFTG